MNILKRLLKRFLAACKAREGFTLVEATASTAIIGTLAAIAVPIALDKIDQSKTTQMTGDTKDIASAIVNLVEDIGLTNLGDPDGDDSSVILVLEGPGTRPKDSTGTVDYFEQSSGTNWNSINSASGGTTSADIGKIADHLVSNDPNKDGTPNSTGDYTNWKGPYLSNPVPDPFGNAYLALIQGIREGKPQGDTSNNPPPVYGWIISAGENGRVETDDAEASTLGGDDVGIMLFRNQ